MEHSIYYKPNVLCTNKKQTDDQSVLFAMWLSEMLCQVQSSLLHCHSLNSIQDILSLSFPPFLGGGIGGFSICYCCRRHMGPQCVVNLLVWLCPPPAYVWMWVCAGDRWTESNRREREREGKVMHHNLFVHKCTSSRSYCTSWSSA